MRLVIKEGQGVGIRPHHDHKFQLIENVPDKRYNCTVCLEYCSDHHHSTYGCIPCGIFIHDGSCFERKLPLEIQHFYHPHPLIFSTIPSPQKLTLSRTEPSHRNLTLSITPSPPTFTCKACRKQANKIHWFYSCKQQCQDFVMDISCTTPTSTSITSESQIRHFLHGHPLSFRNKDVDDQQVGPCQVCMKCCTGPTYVCGKASSDYCEYIYFHKSCLEFQQQIFHPFHPYHHLTLLDQSYLYRRCNARRNNLDPNSQFFNYY